MVWKQCLESEALTRGFVLASPIAEAPNGTLPNRAIPNPKKGIEKAGQEPKVGRRNSCA